MTTQFIMTATVLEEFFLRVKELEVDSEYNRIRLILNMIAEGFPITVIKTERSPEQVVEDYAKHGDVLYLRAQDPDKTLEN